MNETIQENSLWFYKAADPGHPDHVAGEIYYRARIVDIVPDGEFFLILFEFLDEEDCLLIEDEYMDEVIYMQESMYSEDFLKAYELIDTSINVLEYIL